MDDISPSAPLISVLIPLYNEGSHVRELLSDLNSALQQTGCRFEVLLVDDGSSDGSTTIASSYLDQHPRRVRYLEHSGHANRGMSASRNLGIRNARGAYIAFLDADHVNGHSPDAPEKMPGAEREIAFAATHVGEHEFGIFRLVFSLSSIGWRRGSG